MEASVCLGVCDCRACDQDSNSALLHNATLVTMSDYLVTLRAAYPPSSNSNSSSSSSSSICSQQNSPIGLPGRPRQRCMQQPDPAPLLAAQQQALLVQLQACAEQPRLAARQLMRQQVSWQRVTAGCAARQQHCGGRCSTTLRVVLGCANACSHACTANVVRDVVKRQPCQHQPMTACCNLWVFAAGVTAGDTSSQH